MLPASSSADTTGVGVTLPQTRGRSPPGGTLVGGAGHLSPQPLIPVLPVDVEARLLVAFVFLFLFFVFNNVQGF